MGAVRRRSIGNQVGPQSVLQQVVRRYRPHGGDAHPGQSPGIVSELPQAAKESIDAVGAGERDPLHLPLPMSRTDLANHLGLTLECLSRVLGSWKRAGVIETSREQINILKPLELTTTAFHLTTP